LFLMQFGIWRAAAFVSSPIHLLILTQYQRVTDGRTDGAQTGTPPAPMPRSSQGLKTLFCVHEDELLWAADELLTEEGQTHHVLSHNEWPERYHGCEQWRIHGGGGRSPPQSESGLWRVFSGNQFSQFVVSFLFLFQGLINSSPITNLSPQDCECVCAIRANKTTDNDTHTCISTLCEADTNTT